MSLTVGSLFSGIGGLDLGLERAGMTVRWQVEIDDYARRVLAKHWPDVPRHGDIRELTGEELEPVDLICGGFPCNDISRVGRRGGLGGQHSGLWRNMARIIRHLQPGWVFVENVTSLLVRGMGDVLGDLAACGYDAEWDCLPAAAFGAPHIRDRLFLVAYSGQRRHRLAQETLFAGRPRPQLDGWWTNQPRVHRVDDGAPAGVERRRVIGAAVVPQVAEYIGRRILEAAS